MTIRVNLAREGLSNAAANIIAAAEQGYVVEEDGRVRGLAVGYRRPRISSTGYYTFTIRRDGTRRRHNVDVHRLQAFQMFGEDVFLPGVHVRHLDGNPLNNARSNIAIGSAHENQMDRPPEVRRQHAIRAASALRKLTFEQVKEIRAARAAGERTSEVAQRFGVLPSTVCDVVKGRIYRGAA